MPWGMQNFVNGWVKVNQKSVGHPRGINRPQTIKEDKVRESVGYHSSSGDGLNSYNDDNVGGQHPSIPRKSKEWKNATDSYNQEVETDTTASSSTKTKNSKRQDAEVVAIRRVNHRKNKRGRIKRTVSHSDLLRDMAMSKEDRDKKQSERGDDKSNNHYQTVSSTRSSAESSKQPSSASTSDTVQHSNNQQNRVRSRLEDDLQSRGDQSAISTNSIPWLDNIFGGGESVKSSGSGVNNTVDNPLSYPSTTSKYLNETAFVQQYNQQLQHSTQIPHQQQRQRRPTGSTKTSDGSAKLRQPSSPHQNGHKDPKYQRTSSIGSREESSVASSSPSNSHRRRTSHSNKLDDNNSIGGESGAGRGPLHAEKPQGGLLGMHSPWLGLQQQVGSQPHMCPHCEETESRLLAVEADLEYLRSVAIQNEYSCQSCENQSISRRKKKSMNGSSSAASGTESAALTEASQRLMEVTARHKRQMEQLTQERLRWQHDMHLKLSKFSTMCRHLNEEAGIRNAEAVALEKELFETQSERNALATEVQQLRAQVSNHAIEQDEARKVKSILLNYEEEGLKEANKVILERDTVIAELTSRLEETLDTLELEREQQRQRRQIIFPVSRTSQQQQNQQYQNHHQHQLSNPSNEEVEKLKEELLQSKEKTRALQEMVETTKIESARREEALRLRCEQLELHLS